MSIEANEVPLPADAENHVPGQTALPSSPMSALTAQGARLLERRSEARYPTRDPVEVQILGQNKLARVAAMALDVSRKGLRIELLAPIPKGSQVEIILARTLIIFGEVRYCRRVGETVHAGILIQQVVHPRSPAVEHMSDEVLSLYLVGKGLTVPEVIQLKEHLILCNACQLRLAEMNAILNPVRKRKGLGGAG
jgi:hypothetical protein